MPTFSCAQELKKNPALHFLYTHTQAKLNSLSTAAHSTGYWLILKRHAEIRHYHWVDCLFSLHVIKVELRLSSHFHSERCSHLRTIVFANKIFRIKSWLTKMGLWSILLQQLLDVKTNEKKPHKTSCFLLVTALFGIKFIWNCPSTAEEICTVFCWINPRFCQKNYWTSTYYRIRHCPPLCMYVHYKQIYKYPYISKLFYEHGRIHLDSSFSTFTSFYLLYAIIF